MFSRREILAGGAAAAAQAVLPAQTGGKPNIVLFLADDLGCHDVGAWGAADLKTPHIDALAAGGARFTNWYAAAPVCAPSRAALLTGRYPIRAGVPDNGQPLRAAEKTIAHVSEARGAMPPVSSESGTWARPHETDPNAHGFDRFFGFHSGCIDYYSHRYYWGEPRTVNYHDLWRDRTEIFEDGQYTTEMFAREAVQFIRENRARPFFRTCRSTRVHYPMHAPRSTWSAFPTCRPERRTYAAMIAAIDDAVGQVLGTLRELRSGRQHPGDLHRRQRRDAGKRARDSTANRPPPGTTRLSAGTSSAPSMAACTCR